MLPKDLIRRARETGRRSLNEADGKRFLAAFGVPVPKFAVVEGADHIDTPLATLRGPFAVKVLSQDILHKSDVGGVVLGAREPHEVRTAIQTIARQPAVSRARVDGYLIEEMCAAGLELVIGAIRDAQFGPMIMVGLGGIFVEVLGDVAFRLCPIKRDDALAMLDELRAARMLGGVRGRKAVDRDAVVELLLRIGGADGVMMAHEGDIEELDLNPVIAHERGATVVDARFVLAEHHATLPEARTFDAKTALERFTPLFAPRTVAVLGASTTSTTIANTFIRRMKEFGYPGTIYPIHREASEIEGLRCYPSLAQTPEPVDYAYVAIGARAIPDLLRNANGRVRFAHVISSGFGEVSGGADLQQRLLEGAREGGCRILGPNSLGMYSPRGGVTFPVGAPREVGNVGVISQSGGLGTDIIKRGQWRGVRFSGLVTVGNSADIGPVDLLEFYLADPQTRVVGLYLEDVKDGRRFFDVLRSTPAPKPVVILRGGRSSQGRAAALSHTGAMAGDGRAWQALTQQTPCVLVETVDQFIDALLAFQFLSLRQQPTRRVVLFGNGGGTSVLAADAFAECGLDVMPFDAATIARLEALKLPPGTSVANPIDAPVATLQEDEGRVAGRILQIVYQSALPDALVMHINLASFVGRGGADPIDNLVAAALEVQKAHVGRTHVVIALRVDGSPDLDERRRQYRERILAAGIPVYDELVDAAQALRAVRWIEERCARR
ncbi:MAG TPA: acetate--CoA ligase family protein [Casimicrobiaceae bacterium]|nr:acetate--CoA ligase family protein [Casimicrobiaceae bacterium]